MGIFKFHEIKNSKPLLDYLAKEIGGGEYLYSTVSSIC
jgi:hypothetical protein